MKMSWLSLPGCRWQCNTFVPTSKEIFIKFALFKKAYGKAPPSAPLGLWDLCGTSVILQEAGGVITDYRGNQLRYDQVTPFAAGIVASNGVVQEN